MGLQSHSQALEINPMYSKPPVVHLELACFLSESLCPGNLSYYHRMTGLQLCIDFVSSPFRNKSLQTVMDQNGGQERHLLIPISHSVPPTQGPFRTISRKKCSLWSNALNILLD